MANEQLTDGGKLHLKIMTPSSTIFEEDVLTLTAPGEYGDIGVLPGHAPLLSNLRIGIMDVTSLEHDVMYFAINKGFIEIVNDVITILSETAEDAKQIDVTRAEESLKRAQERIDSKKSDKEIDVKRAKESLERAKIRISVAKTMDRLLK